MTFAQPYILYFSWTAGLLLLLIIVGISRRRRFLEEYAAEEGLARLTAEAAAGKRYVKGGLVTAAFVLLIIALAGPRYGYHWEEVSQTGVDIVIALDCSRSMLVEDVSPSRLARAKHKIVDLLDRLGGDRVGLVAFAGEAFLQCPLTMDYGALTVFLETLSPDFIPRGGTNLAAAVETAGEAFDFEYASDKAVILITDGEANSGPDPVEAAREAAARGIKLFAIGIGTPPGRPVPDGQGGFIKDDRGEIVISRLDEATLGRMAAVSGGVYTRATVADDDLDLIYNLHIRKKMEQTTLDSSTIQIRKDRFQWFVALALLFLLIEMMLPARNSAVLLLLVGLCLVTAAPARAENIYSDVRQGRSAYEEENYEKALRHFIEAQLKDPQNARLSYNIGSAFYKKGEYAEAARHFEEALNAAGDDSRLQRDIFYNLGNTHFRRNDFTAAIEQYGRALEIDENDEQARDNLALAEKALERQQQQRQEAGERREQQQQSREEEGERQEQPEGQDNRDEQQQELGGSRDPQEETASPADQTGPEKPAGEGDTAIDEESADTKETPVAPRSEEDAERPAGIGADKLQRLRDKPGAAMIPDYKGRKVERDW